MVYTDPNGVPRRAIIPIDPAAPGEAPETPGADDTAATEAPDGGTAR